MASDNLRSFGWYLYGLIAWRGRSQPLCNYQVNLEFARAYHEWKQTPKTLVKWPGRVTKNARDSDETDGHLWVGAAGGCLLAKEPPASDPVDTAVTSSKGRKEQHPTALTGIKCWFPDWLPAISAPGQLDIYLKDNLIVAACGFS